MPEHEPPAQSFAAYAETVFRRQNHATSQIMMLSFEDIEDQAMFNKLLNAEKLMHAECRLLNQYAEQSQHETNASFLLSARVGKSIADCEQATEKVETLLDALNE